MRQRRDARCTSITACAGAELTLHGLPPRIGKLRHDVPYDARRLRPHAPSAKVDWLHEEVRAPVAPLWLSCT